MKHNYSAKYDNILIRPLEKKDIENLRIWRNDEKQTKFLRHVGYITPEMQKSWYEEYINNKNEVTFAIVETSDLNRIVGSLALYDFTDNIAEIGKIQIGDLEARGKGYGRISLVLAMWIGFKKMGIKKIISSVHQENIAAHKNDMKIGFKIVGNHPFPFGGTEDDIEINEVQLREANSYVDDIELDVEV